MIGVNHYFCYECKGFKSREKLKIVVCSFLLLQAIRKLKMLFLSVYIFTFKQKKTDNENNE